MDGEFEFNSRVFVFGLIFIGILIAIFFPYQIFEKPKIVPVSINITATPTPIIEYIYVTPTPDNGIYYAGEYQDGIRKLGRTFSWFQYNVTGLKDMSGHVKIYEYRIFPHLHVYNDAEAKYFEMYPNNGEKFLFIFVKIYLDNIIGDDSRMWVPNEFHYIVNVNDKQYYPIVWGKHLRIRELEEAWNDNGDYRIGYYGTFKTYSRNLKYASTAGISAEQIYYIKGGESNAVDGYIVYSIPESTDEKDIKIIGNMYAFGDPIWILKL
jgi:hypothetical protein